ncbi:prepilin-type N-terminal cleavage/methylation domain-containing protein, partial [Campylobacter sp.]
MKKGFTMIELIFVIVILGILASVAIPRLAA